ncbi:hypothetical protein HWV62_18642 [Athelia sp. TMB]|nr:hypothetical protein HWV62_18642 [Athelia sp. TMB]
MPAWLHEDSQENRDYQALQNPDSEHHKAHFSHEFLASAAAGFVANEFQKRQEKATGNPSQHKVLIDGASALAAGFLTNLVETKGLDYLDKRKLEQQGK